MKLHHIIQKLSPPFVFYLKVCDRSRSPQWDEAFYSVVRDPTAEMLIVKVSTLCLTMLSRSFMKPAARNISI